MAIFGRKMATFGAKMAIFGHFLPKIETLHAFLAKFAQCAQNGHFWAKNGHFWSKNGHFRASLAKNRNFARISCEAHTMRAKWPLLGEKWSLLLAAKVTFSRSRLCLLTTGVTFFRSRLRLRAAGMTFRSAYNLVRNLILWL